MILQEDIGDNLHLVFQVVEDEQGIGDHEETVGKMKVLRKEFRYPFKGPDHIITAIAYSTPKKSRKAVMEEANAR